MTIQPVAPSRPIPPAKIVPAPPRRRKPRVAIEHEDDDWIPPARLPTHAAREFFDNDYDVM